MIRTFQDRAYEDMRDLLSSLPLLFRERGGLEPELPEDSSGEQADNRALKDEEAFYWGCCIHSHW